MNNLNFGQLSKAAEGFAVRFERELAYPVQTVWDAITNPEKLKYWFTDIAIDLRPGGKITFYFRDEAHTESYGEVISVEAPKRFVFTWETEMGVWELKELGPNRTLLILSYSKMDAQLAVGASAGFHSLLDRLLQMLQGDTSTYPFGTEEHDPLQTRLRAAYAEKALTQFPELLKYEPLVLERVYKASPERVWKAITDKEEMKQWYFELSAFEPKVGFKFSFPGQGTQGEHYLHHCEITEVIPLQKLTYSWSYESYEGISYVSFELFPDQQGTRLKLTHKGLHTFPAHPDFDRSCFQAGWTELLGTLLKQHVEA